MKSPQTWYIIKQTIMVNRDPSFLTKERIARMGSNANIESFKYSVHSQFQGPEKRAESHMNAIERKCPEAANTPDPFDPGNPIKYKAVSYELWSDEYYDDYSTTYPDMMDTPEPQYDHMTKEELIQLLKNKQ